MGQSAERAWLFLHVLYGSCKAQGPLGGAAKILSLRESAGDRALPTLTPHRGFTMLRHFSLSVAEQVFHEGRRR
jgi:hypothetical protein